MYTIVNKNTSCKFTKCYLFPFTTLQPNIIQKYQELETKYYQLGQNYSQMEQKYTHQTDQYKKDVSMEGLDWQDKLPRKRMKKFNN